MFLCASISRKSVLLFSFCKHFDKFREINAQRNIQCVGSRLATVVKETILKTSESCRLIKKRIRALQEVFLTFTFFFENPLKLTPEGVIIELILNLRFYSSHKAPSRVLKTTSYYLKNFNLLSKCRPWTQPILFIISPFEYKRALYLHKHEYWGKWRKLK